MSNASAFLLLVGLLGGGACGRGPEDTARAPASDAPAIGPAQAEAWREARTLQDAAVERTGFPLEIESPVGPRLRLVPEGVFTMGSPEGEPGRADEEAPHEVHLVRSFYLQTTEVTNAQYRRFLAEAPSTTGVPPALGGADDEPVAGVSWDDAVAFAAWMARTDPRFVYRLPTEAEWEYACRAGTTTPFACGDDVGPRFGTVAGSDAPGRPAAVATHAANAWGLFDLHGNVAEWCHDRYGAYALWRVDNPQGAASGDERVVRGGSWADPAAAARSAARGHLPAGARRPTVGFRLACGLGYGRTGYGRHEILVRTVDPTVDPGEDPERPGWPIYMISVIDRLTDRANQIPDPRWTLLPQATPIRVHLAPGIYYVYSYRMEGDRKVRSEERKFAVPGPDGVDCPIPRPYQANPQ